MSVSEKLKALDETLFATPEWTMGAWPDKVVVTFGDLERLLSCVPEIIAVVEAAENPTLFDYDRVGDASKERLQAALAALDEALQ